MRVLSQPSSQAPKPSFPSLESEAGTLRWGDILSWQGTFGTRTTRPGGQLSNPRTTCPGGGGGGGAAGPGGHVVLLHRKRHLLWYAKVPYIT